ncbi:hypothetical protein ISO99_07160 [Staphylococcus sp. 18_1_E_LY]|uniref:Uncharacterized protein n=1 Tax=Staphylococcus lloydii TaxID=2781774 RepID=A0A7T1AZT3_9STAP|nr:hypothetical protein [Staphylococcus lloydii]MBF7019691.1 hypothetical protein [Staphylococcus lloydii]MBF7027419.1 hypothetical protein [Staphylococcus lloydii]QPM75078.1 hypothetical protein ISP08_12290 [Staphylococcus lloydii]
MTKSKLRIVFNILLAIWILGYGVIYLFTDIIDAKWSLIFVFGLVIIGVTRSVKTDDSKDNESR